jgi:hypothetical protein
MSVATFTLTSATSNAAAPFVLGHAFKRGDVPAGSQLVGSIANLQVTPKNAWPDGSLKFAVVAGRAALTANTPLAVALSLGTPAASTALTTADLKATGITAAIGTDTFGSASWSGVDWDAPFMAWVSGPEMSSWIYRKPVGSDVHLVGWLEVRLFAGGAVEVLPWIENGYILVAAPTNKLANYTFSLGGTQRFGASIDLKHHQRTVLINGTELAYWLGTDPGVTARADRAYLQASELVPSYSAQVANGAAVVVALVTSYEPLQAGNFNYDSDAMASPGYQDPIGLLPQHDVLYLTSDAPATYGAVVRNGYSAGRWGIHYRDESTGRPLKFSDYPHLNIRDSQGFKDNGASTTGQYTPVVSGGNPPQWDIAHSPSVGYLAYLLTGRWYFMEEVQFATATNYLGNGDSSILRDGTKGLVQPCLGAWQTRSTAWDWRARVQALCVTPDADTALRAELIASVESNITHFHGRYVAQSNNPQGWLIGGAYTSGALNVGAPWMEDFVTAAFGYSISLGLPISSTASTKLAAFFQWKAKSVIMRLGPQGAFWYINADPYTMPVSPSTTPDFVTGTGPWYNSDAELYAAAFTPPTPWMGSTEGVLAGEIMPGERALWGNLLPAISYAVRHGVPGANTAYARLIGATNYSNLSSAFDQHPVWSVQPLFAGASTVSTPGPSFIWDSQPLIAGSFIWDTHRGHGIKASELPTGFPNDPLLTKHIPAGADPNSEFRWHDDTVPAGLTLTVYTDSSAEASGADGVYNGTKTVYTDGIGDPGTYSFTFGTAAPTVTGVTVSPATVTVAGGASQTFTATVTGTNSPSQAVTWAASAGAITSGGAFTAPPATTGAQTITITATSVADGTKSGTATVTVPAAVSTVTGVAVTPSSGAVAAGATRAHTATVTGTGSPSQAVTWSTNLGTINASTGLLTAPAATASVQNGTVTATSTQDPTKSGTSTFTVAAGTPTVTGVTVAPASTNVAGGASQQFTASVAGTFSPSQAVTWSASAGSINSSGQFTAPAATSSVQTITVTATSVANSAKSGSATITINAVTSTGVSSVSSVSINPSSATLTGGAALDFTATVAGTNSPSQAVTWADSAGTISSTGYFIAPEGTDTDQTITVTATSAQDSTKSGSATVTVLALAPAVTRVAIYPETARLAGGGTQSFSALVAGTLEPSQSVTWSCSTGSIDSVGNFTAPPALVNPRYVTITATSAEDSTVAGTVTVVVAALGMIGSAIINAAAFILQDEANDRWSRAEMFDYLQDGLRDLCSVKPDAYVINDKIKLVAGTKQALPDNCNAFVRLVRNLGTSGAEPGRAPRKIALDVMDQQNPNWHIDPASQEVLEYVFDERDPKHFYVSPPQPAISPAWVEAVYSAIPPQLESEASALPVDDSYKTVLEHYLCDRAYLKEGQYQDSSAAAAHRAEFFALLSAKDAGETKAAA